MFLPIGDSPNPKGNPFVTYALVLANVAVFLLFNLPLGAQRADVRDSAFREYVEVVAREAGGDLDLRRLVAATSQYDLFAFRHGYRPASPELIDLLSCMFLHGSLMHLVGNMLFLWIYGDNVERRLGALAYLAAYLATGVAATLAHALVFSSSQVPLVGASGAISGVLGFYFVFFPRNTVRMLAVLPPFLMQVFTIPARFVLGMYLLVDNLLPFFLASRGGVAHGAHIGGFVVGAAAAWLLEQRALGTPASERLPAAAQEAVPLAEAVTLAGSLRESGRAEAALALLRRAIRAARGEQGLAQAHALAGAILLQDLGTPATAYQYLLAALELDPDPETAAGVRRLLRQIEELQKHRIGRLHSPPRW